MGGFNKSILNFKKTKNKKTTFAKYIEYEINFQ